MNNLQKDIASFNKLVRIGGSVISAVISGTLAGFNQHSLYNGVLAGLAILFTITFGFSINDYFDHEKDSLYPDKHVIAAGELTRRQVGYIAMVLFLLSVVCTLFLHPFQQWINASLLVILSVYSWINNRYGILANVLVAICSSLSILIALQGMQASMLSWASLSVLFFITGREIVKDIHDVAADASVGKSSVPIRLGNRTAFLIALALTLASLLFSIFTGLYFQRWAYVLITFLAHVLYFYYMIKYQGNMDQGHYLDFSKYSKISFLMLVPALIISLL